MTKGTIRIRHKQPGHPSLTPYQI